MGDLRDRADVMASKADMRRAAQAGGPRRIARSFGTPRGSDRFPSAKSVRRSKGR